MQRRESDGADGQQGQDAKVGQYGECDAQPRGDRQDAALAPGDLRRCPGGGRQAEQESGIRPDLAHLVSRATRRPDGLSED